MPIGNSSFTRWLPLVILCCILLVACESEPAGQDGTPDAESAAELPTAVAASPVAPGGAETTQPQPTLRFYVQGTDNTVYLVSMGGERTRIGEGQFRSPIETTLPGNPVAGGRAYLLTMQGPAEGKVYSVGLDGASPLDFILGTVQSLAVWPGNESEPARLAWDSYNIVVGSTDLHSQIVVSEIDGSNQRVLLEETDQQQVLVVGRWSSDGKRLYFSKEPLGLGGYILFGGASDLWVYDFARENSKQLLSDKLGSICIDDLSPDETYIAEHCALDVLGMINLETGDIGTIASPIGLEEKTVVGGALFDPAGQRVSFALARNNPESEQGWAAVSESLDGASDLLAQAPAGDYFRIAAWLNEDLILLQSLGTTPGVWTVQKDGAGLKRIAEGTFLGTVESP